jgi:apoptosis-inducing factor 2
VTIKDRTKDIDEFSEKIKNAKSILVAGGGIVGCEVAGELAVAYGKEKKIGICLRGEKLMH